MLSIQSFKERFTRYVIRIGQARLRQQLLLRDDRFLVDTGFSRELLERGVGAWPWRISEAKVDKPALPQRDDRQAITELEAYSDVELADLGLVRSQIPDAVRHGRPGIDTDLQHAA